MEAEPFRLVAFLCHLCFENVLINFYLPEFKSGSPSPGPPEAALAPGSNSRLKGSTPKHGRRLGCLSG